MNMVDGIPFTKEERFDTVVARALDEVPLAALCWLPPKRIPLITTSFATRQ